MGQGFGGWEADYSKHTDYFLPPHNTLIYLWSKSGLIASLLGLGFILCCIRIALRAIRSIDEKQKNIGFSFLMVISWLFAHGFGENFGLIGEQHQMVVFSVMFGLCLAGNLPINRNFRVQE